MRRHIERAAIVGSVIAAVVAGAIYLRSGVPAQATTPAPTARTATVTASGHTVLAIGSYRNGVTVRVDLDRPFDATQMTLIVATAVATPDIDATCTITVDGVQADQAHGSGDGGQALCTWTPPQV